MLVELSLHDDTSYLLNKDTGDTYAGIKLENDEGVRVPPRHCPCREPLL